MVFMRFLLLEHRDRFHHTLASIALLNIHVAVSIFVTVCLASRIACALMFDTLGVTLSLAGILICMLMLMGGAPPLCRLALALDCLLLHRLQ